MAFTLVNYDKGPNHLDLTMTFTTVNDESPWFYLPYYLTHGGFSSGSGGTAYTVLFRGVYTPSLISNSSAVVGVASATEASPTLGNTVASLSPWPWMQFRLTVNPTPQTVTMVIGFRR